MRLLALSLMLSACATDNTDGTDAPGTDTSTETQSETESETGSETDTETEPDDCGTIETFADATPTREIFVYPHGDDDTGDGSKDNPYATPSKALSANIQPGTAVRIGPGTYTRATFVRDLRGTASQPIWIGGIAGQARPVFSGDSEGLHLSRVSYVVLHDVEVRDTSSNGINIDDGGETDNAEATHHVVVQGVHVHDIGGTGNQDCLKLSGLRDYFVLDSTFERCGGGISGSGIDHVGCHRGLLAHNVLRDTSGSGVQIKGGSADIDVRWNRFERPGERGVNMGGSTGYAYFRPPLDADAPNAEAWRVTVRANLFEGGVAALAFVGCVDCEAVNNTIVDPTNWVIRILQETRSDDTYSFEPAKNGVMQNNLVSVDRSKLSRWINIGGGTDADSFTFDHELWHARDQPDDRPSLPGTVSASIEGNPALSGDDYAPAVDGAAAGAGVLTDLRGDRLGTCYGDPPTVGAIEVR